MRQTIPYEFVVKQKIPLSWSELLWGYAHALVDWSFPISMAIDCIQFGSDSDLIVELASATKSEAHKVGDILTKLASSENAGTEAKSKWLFLALAWLFDQKDSLEDPLAEVERIYADFDYPTEIENLVRYMPTTDGYDPSLHSKRENEDRLHTKWADFLVKEGNIFRGTISG